MHLYLSNNLYSQIRNIVGNDNSLRQSGIHEVLEIKISKSQLDRDIKAAGLVRKRFKNELTNVQLVNIKKLD